MRVARELIETGKPRSALDVLAEHHARLADDAEYLMLCGQAWFAAGDAPRAQHALLGAARIAPEDPRPLQLLGDLLLERGETERANRLFRKAARLGKTEAPVADDFDEPERGEGDLIAFAERKERRRRSPAPLRQWTLMLLTVGGLGALMSAIASWVSPSEPLVATRAAGEGATSVAAADDDATEPPVEMTPPPAETTPSPAEPQREVTRKVPRESTVPVPAQKPTVPAPPPDPEPDAAVLEGTRWPEPNATPMLAPPAPIAESSVPTAALVVPEPEKVVKKKKPRSTARRPSRTARPAAAPPAISDEAIDAELEQVADAPTATDRGDQLVVQGQLAAAARFYRRALDLDTDYAPALIAIGRSLLRAEMYGDAMRSATRALQLARGVDARPGLEAEALYQMGRVQHEWGHQDAARRLLRQSISMPRAPAEAWFYLGESLARDNWPDARAAYEEYLERRPNGHLSDRARRAIQ